MPQKGGEAVKKMLSALGLTLPLALLLSACFGAFLYLARNTVQEPFPQPDWGALALWVEEARRQLAPLRCLLPPGVNLGLELWAYYH